MDLTTLLKEKKAGIIEKWLEALVATYPDNTAQFYRKKNAQFANPVGYTFAQGAEGLFDALVSGVMPSETSDFLDGIIRIRAVQEFAPSQAVGFIYELKKIVRSELRGRITSEDLAESLERFQSAVDDLALFAFDLYMKCRERIFRNKVDEVNRSTFRLLQRAQRSEGTEE